MNTREQMDQYVMATYGRLPIVFQSGQEREAVDEDQKSYVDFGSGIGTNSLGFCDEKWVERVTRQAATLQHTSNYYYTKIQADFARQLCQRTGYVKLFFGNSGAEANECAIKLARKYSYDKYGPDAERNIILTLQNSFHGRTLTTLSATGQDVFHNYFFPFTPGFDYVPANDIQAFENKLQELDGKVCGVMLEFIQGEGGVVPLDKDFVLEVFRICEQKDIITIADEVQTGVGRTGTFLAGEQYGVKPDVTTLAKGIAGGLPMGICLAGEPCSDTLGKGAHGSTFGGNPICCAGGLAVLERLAQPGFLENVREKGRYLRGKLLEIPGIESVDGLGLMLGARLTDASAPQILQDCHEEGLLILTAKDKLRFLPPLTITQEEIDRGLTILEKILRR